jgi:hypothetical protein
MRKRRELDAFQANLLLNAVQSDVSKPIAIKALDGYVFLFPISLCVKQEEKKEERKTKNSIPTKQRRKKKKKKRDEFSPAQRFSSSFVTEKGKVQSPWEEHFRRFPVFWSLVGCLRLGVDPNTPSSTACLLLPSQGHSAHPLSPPFCCLFVRMYVCRCGF